MPPQASTSEGSSVPRRSTRIANLEADAEAMDRKVKADKLKVDKHDTPKMCLKRIRRTKDEEEKWGKKNLRKYSISEIFKLLHSTFWKQPLPPMLLQTVVDSNTFDYVPRDILDGLNLNLLNFPEALLIFRGEYRTARDTLKSWKKPPVKGVVVTGYPGIGKTYFLLLVLLQRLSEGLPTAVQYDTDTFIFFTDQGPTDHLGIDGFVGVETLAEVEEACCTAIKKSTEMNLAQLAAQSSHRFLMKAMDATDELQENTGKKGALKGAVMGGIGGGFYLGFDRTRAGDECTMLAVKAQACLNEVFRVLGPYEDRMEEDARESYGELKKMGVLHASKFVNILNSGMLTTDRIANLMRMTLERQTAFGHLTRLAVWYSGIYTIKNVKNHNWAVLLNADDRGEVVAGSHKDGEKWNISKLPNDTYVIRNQFYSGNYASYPHFNRGWVTSVRESEPLPWHIYPREGGYVICDLDDRLVWSLWDDYPKTPVNLNVYQCNQRQLWDIIPDGFKEGKGLQRAEESRRDLIRGTKLTTVTDGFSDCIIIAVVGPTGSGKSSFIDMAAGGGKSVGHGLGSCTTEVSITKIRCPGRNDLDVIFVDTPGFDDTFKTDVEILCIIAEWWMVTYNCEIKLSGILYFHRISDNRVAGSPYKNLVMFEKLCGMNAPQNIILTTTMWDQVDDDVGSGREKELMAKHWKGMMDQGSKTVRYYNSAASAWNVIEHFVQVADARFDVLLRMEMVDIKKQLCKTQAGQALYGTLEMLVEKQQVMLKEIRADTRRRADNAMLSALKEEYEDIRKQHQEEYEDIQKRLQDTYDEMLTLNIPPGRRLLCILRRPDL